MSKGTYTAKRKKWNRDWLDNNPERRIIQRVKSRAKKADLEFSLTPEDLLPLPTHCPVLGIKLNYQSRDNKAWDNPSLDRIDSSKGYTPDNVCVVSWRVNSLKKDATLCELMQIVEFYKDKMDLNCFNR